MFQDTWLDTEPASGEDHLGGAGFIRADITLLTTIDFAAFIGLAPTQAVSAAQRWHGRVSAPPSGSGNV